MHEVQGLGKWLQQLGSNQRLGRTNEKEAADLNSWLLFQLIPHSETAYSHFFSLLGPWRTYLSETINEQISNTNLLKALTMDINNHQNSQHTLH